MPTALIEEGIAAGVIADRKDLPKHDRLFVVDDSLKALQELAKYHREQLGLPIIGITGTNGKTTTKELISAVLSKKYNIIYTQGNFNNDVGVPKTLLRLSKEHDIAVIEMGASHPGDIIPHWHARCPPHEHSPQSPTPHMEFLSIERRIISGSTP